MVSAPTLLLVVTPDTPTTPHHAAQPLAGISLEDCGLNRLVAQILKQVLKKVHVFFSDGPRYVCSDTPQMVSSVQSKGNLIVLESVNREEATHPLICFCAHAFSHSLFTRLNRQQIQPYMHTYMHTYIRVCVRMYILADSRDKRTSCVPQPFAHTPADGTT